MTCTPNNLSNEVSKLKPEFEKLRTEINSNLGKCSNSIAVAEKFCQQATEMTTNLEKKLANVSNEEKNWEGIRVKLATTSLKGMIILNVGGDKYTTSVETLTREPDTFFTALFSKQWETERDPQDKSIFIDRDGKLFSHILVYLRTNQLPNDIGNNESLLRGLIIEAEYFRLHSLISVLNPCFLILNSKLLNCLQKMKLNEFYGIRDQRWELIYRASRDGFDTKAFHSHCDNKGPTMTIVRSNNNYLFGGYTSVAWSSNAAWINDKNAFLFTLTNPHNIPPTKYQIDPAQAEKAIWHYGTNGPTFGGECDLQLSDKSNSNNNSRVNFPTRYIDTTGKGNNTFTGSTNFTTSEIEIFKLA